MAIALPQPALAAPSIDTDYFISPVMLQISDEIDEALDAWSDCNVECNMRDRAMNAWEKRNPQPVYQSPDHPDYSRTACSDWSKRRHDLMVKLQLYKTKKQRSELAEIYQSAVRRFAEFEATTPSELYSKVSHGICVDSSNSLIAKSVLHDLYRFRGRLFAQGIRA